jgi:hypothetical protein
MWCEKKFNVDLKLQTSIFSTLIDIKNLLAFVNNGKNSFSKYSTTIIVSFS